jgi:DNA-binding PadR family transcriptional regulator
MFTHRSTISFTKGILSLANAREWSIGWHGRRHRPLGRGDRGGEAEGGDEGGSEAQPGTLTSRSTGHTISTVDISDVDRPRRSDPRAPLPDAELEILLALVDGEAHGYAMMRAVEHRSGGRTRLGPGTLYAALKRLLAVGLIEESDRRRDPDRGDARRRYYRLTDLGSQVLSAELDRLSALVRHGRRRLRLSPLGGRS